MAPPDSFAVLGDLGNNTYIVRMWISGKYSVDEEFVVDHSSLPLKDKITARMAALDAMDAPTLQSMDSGAPPPDVVSQAITGMD